MEKTVFKVSEKGSKQLKRFLAKYGYRYVIGEEIAICAHCGFPVSLQLSRDQGLTKSCAFKEFRFEPPYVHRKKSRKRKTLPPIPEHMLPRHRDSVEEDGETHIPPLPSLSISPAFLTDRTDERSVSVEARLPSPHSHVFNSREFTFPESSWKRKKQLPSQPSILPALTPRIRDLPLQAKIEKLAKQRRKERAKKNVERRYEKKSHNMEETPSSTTNGVFKSRREVAQQNNFHLKDQKLLPFKQMVRTMDESERVRIPPRLYTRIVDGIYAFTKGITDSSGDLEIQGPFERLMVTPATVRDTDKDDVHRQLTYHSTVMEHM